MKKILLVVAVLMVAVVIFGSGFVFAQYRPAFAQAGVPMTGGQMMGGRGGYGPMHAYVEQALAEKLGLTEAQVEEQLAAGKSMYQIAIDNGTAEADVAALLETVHKTAFDKAVAAGVITQIQADAMFQQMQSRGFGTNCTGNGANSQSGRGFGGMMGGRGGQGGMMGGRGQQQAPQTNP